MTHLTIETVECPACGHTHQIEVDTEKAMKEAKEKFERQLDVATIPAEVMMVEESLVNKLNEVIEAVNKMMEVMNKGVK